MKRGTIIATAVLFAAIVAVAIAAAPTATVEDVTGSSLTLGSLKCGATYEIQLSENGSEAQTLTQQTKPCPVSAPSADFSITPEPAQRTVPTIFASTGTCAATPCSYIWRHGPPGSEQFGTGTSATFTYTGPVGTRSVELTVTDSQGRSDSELKTFQLVQPTATPTPTPTATSSPTPTATPTPTPLPPGGFPDALNTGVPLGVLLTPSGGMTITTAGTVIDGRDISGSVTVSAPNVTIRNSRIRSGGFWVVQNRSTGLLIEDSEINGLGANNNCLGSNNITVRRTEIAACENGMDISGAGNVTVEDNWIHDLVIVNGAHTDGIQIGQGAADLTIRHNTIRPKLNTAGPDATSAIIMWDEGDPQNTRVRIEDNRLDGTGASRALYCPRQPASAIYIIRNRMLRGVYGAYADACIGSHVTEFNGNVDDVTGAPIGPGD